MEILKSSYTAEDKAMLKANKNLRSLIRILCLVSVVSLAACGGSSDFSAVPSMKTVSAAKIYVAKPADGAVAVVDAASSNVITSFGVCSDPVYTIVAAAQNKGFVGCSESISIFDTQANTLIEDIPLAPSVVGLESMALSPDGSRLYFTGPNSNSHSATYNAFYLDIATKRITALSGNGEARVIAVSADGSKAYVVTGPQNQSTNSTLRVIDVASNVITASIPVGRNAKSIAVSADGSRVYVGNLDSSTISVIDANTNAVVATWTTPGNPESIAISPNGSKIYVVDGSDKLLIFNATTGVAALTQVTTEPAYPWFVTLDSNGGKAYVVLFKGYSENSKLAVVDTSTNTLTSTLSLGTVAFSVAAP